MNCSWFWVVVRNRKGTTGLFANSERHAAEKWAKWNRPSAACTVEVDAGDRRYIRTFRVTPAAGRAKVEAIDDTGGNLVGVGRRGAHGGRANHRGRGGRA